MQKLKKSLLLKYNYRYQKLFKISIRRNLEINERPRVGRPSKGKRQARTLRIAPADYKKIKDEAQRREIDINELIIKLVLEGIERSQKRFEAPKEE